MKTHTFNGRRYRIDFASYIGGVTDVPGPCRPDNLSLTIVPGDKLTHLDNALHEGLEAMGAPDELMHNRDGSSKTADLARFLWWLGYRKVEL